jgi:hypothetical protein
MDRVSVGTTNVRALARDEVIAAIPLEVGEKLNLPDFDRLNWDNLDFLGWCDRSGDRAYFVFDHAGEVSALALDRMMVQASKARGFMCSICRTVHGIRGIANYTYRSRRGPGYHTLTDMFCGDLQCSLYVRGLLSTDGAQFYETITVARKVERLQSGIDRYLDTIAAFDARRKAGLRLV